jgi:hypothetical protein
MYSPITGEDEPGGVLLVITILAILPYCPKYSFERRVGISWNRQAELNQCAALEGVSHLFLCETRTKSGDVDDVALNNPHISEVSAVKCLELLAFSLPLFLLLSQSLVAWGKWLYDKDQLAEDEMGRVHDSLLGVDGLELDRILSILATASGAATI